MIIINFVLALWVSTACLFHDHDPREIKVVYNHTCLASYLHLRVGNVGGEYDYWLLEGNKFFTAGGFPSSGLCQTCGCNEYSQIKDDCSAMMTFKFFFALD